MGETTTEFRSLLARLQAGEPGAARDLIARAYPRLLRLARTMIGSFPAVGRVHEPDSVVNDAYGKLTKAVESVPLAAAADFFRLAAFKLRQTLLEMAAKPRLDVIPLAAEGGAGSASGGVRDPGRVRSTRPSWPPGPSSTGGRASCRTMSGMCSCSTTTWG